MPSPVMTPDKVREVKQSFDNSPKKSLMIRSQKVKVSKSTIYRTAKKIGLRHFGPRVVQALKPSDNFHRRKFCTWFLSFRQRNPETEVFFTDEAWFYLSGKVSKKVRIWAVKNPKAKVEAKHYPAKIGVWCAISHRRIIGPIFFTDTITAQRYEAILCEFLKKLRATDKTQIFFQQDGAPAHTARWIKSYLRSIFGSNLIGKGLDVNWPPRSPDLTPPDFFLCGFLKNTVYRSDPKTLEELKLQINLGIRRISKKTLKKTADSVLRRAILCRSQKGGHFQHLLRKQ
ncbi:uncharacterized protein B4U80_02162 [Leptotrombidium deliense]|uniref:Transposase-like protein n=1 Tax=Leptotrombidium deliense TaxID=299467 RepID=A0A443RYN4_9ACAR|nr:uncharacterized protein B4U80_02162 [Leptotrombidium deliense]